MHFSPKTILLTGATGFLGRYFLRDLLLRGKQIVVVGRSRGPVSGQDRIEAILQDWELRLGRRLIRPRFLEGNVCSPNFGIVPNALNQALLGSVDAIVHCAASLRFEEDESREEPLRTNLTGTRNAVAFAQEWGIPHFHYISTAYVCGQRHERILESELELGQEFHNIYEQSKFQAERLVHAANGFSTKTIYRPSIVVGDSVTGFSSTFHTIYSILRFLRALPESNAGNLDWIFKKLQLSGHEGKNLVPVDWVSKTTVDLLETPNAWGQTFHLTNATPVTANQLSDAIAEAIASQRHHWEAMALPASITDAQAAYQMHVDAYRGYLSDDPIFDSAEIQKIFPDLKAPAIDHVSLVRMLSFAIKHRFRDPTIAIPRSIDDGQIRSDLDSIWLDRAKLLPNDANAKFEWTLRLSGLGGGAWAFGNSQHELDGSIEAWAHTTAATWKAIVKNQCTLEQAIQRHLVLISGSRNERLEIEKQLYRLIQYSESHQLTSNSSCESNPLDVLPIQPKDGRHRA